MTKSPTLTEEQVLNALEGAGRGTTVRITYYMGGDPEQVSQTRIIESMRAYRSNIPLEQYTGTLENLRRNKRGQWYFTLFVEERDTLHPDGELTPGNFRNFNPSVGDLVMIEVTGIVRNNWFAL